MSDNAITVKIDRSNDFTTGIPQLDLATRWSNGLSLFNANSEKGKCAMATTLVHNFLEYWRVGYFELRDDRSPKDIGLQRLEKVYRRLVVKRRKPYPYEIESLMHSTKGQFDIVVVDLGKIHPVALSIDSFGIILRDLQKGLGIPVFCVCWSDFDKSDERKINGLRFDTVCLIDGENNQNYQIHIEKSKFGFVCTSPIKVLFSEDYQMFVVPCEYLSHPMSFGDKSMDLVTRFEYVMLGEEPC